MDKAPGKVHETEQRVVVLMSDMVQYSQRTSAMCPEELKNFIIDYHYSLRRIIDTQNNRPIEIEPSAGDGSLVVLKKRFNENDSAICTRAVQSALRIAYAIEEGTIPPTRIGIFLGDLIEAELCGRIAKFSTSFAVANRLEELCGHFGTTMLMDREVARNQKIDHEYIVCIGKFSLTSILHPMNAYALYKPGIQQIPREVDGNLLLQFIQLKNEAMELFSGNMERGILPDFPRVRTKLIEAQTLFIDMTGNEDKPTSRILEYIRETPYPSADFNSRGMLLLEKKRDSLGDRLFYLSKQLLKAMNYDIYHALVVDTSWEQYFKLEWYKKGSVIIQIEDEPDGIYYIDTGVAKTFNDQGKLLSVMEDGAIFGEMAYFGKDQKRTATVVADSDVVVRRISSSDFGKLPVIREIFRNIAESRRNRMQPGKTTK